MGGETVKGSWFSALWPVSRKFASDDKAAIGILASEVSCLMLKVVNLWHSLSDNEVMSLREEIVNSFGVKMLVSDDENFLMELALNEILSNFQCIARSVARLGKRCEDPVYHRYEQFVNNPVQNYFQWSGWEYRWKKMEKKVKKMERFAAAMTELSRELEVLAEHEQTFRRMRANPQMNRVKLLEYQKKIMLQRQEVRTLRDMSPWRRSYDYVVRLLARSLFTILERIILVFGNFHQQPIEQQENDSECVHANHLRRINSFSIPKHSYSHQSQNDPNRLYSEHLVRRQISDSCFVVGNSQRKKKQQQALPSESKQLGHTGPFIGCISVGTQSPVAQSFKATTSDSMSTRLTDCHVKNVDKTKTADELCLFNRMRIYSQLSINRRLRPPPFTLGDAALAFHYANVIILIEKMASSPHHIDLETRDDLYNMLPTTIRTALRAKLKRRAKSKASSAYDFAEGWSMVVTQILGWLAPLAHNMIRWHSERNFEEHPTSRANILLVQTLHFASQAKTEAAIIELLLGLNCVCRIDKAAGVRDSHEFVVSRSYNGVRLTKNEVFNEYM